MTAAQGHGDVLRRALDAWGAGGTMRQKVEQLWDEREAEIERLRDLFRPEPYHGVRFKLVCSSCGGQGEVNGRDSDDPRWVQCLTCNGDGLAQAAREALSRV